MRNTSRLFTILLLAVMLLSACTPTATPVPATTQEPAPAATEAPAKTEAPAATEAPAPTEAPAKTEAPAATEAPAPTETGGLPDLGGKKVTVAVENAYPPFNVLDPDTNEGIGWDYDAVREICKRLNCTPEFVQAAWDGIFPAMQAGEFDVLADGVTITAERDEIVDFSIPYVTVGQVLLVRADETLDVEAMQADPDKIVGTQLGTTNEIVAKQHFPADRVRSFEDFPASVLALLSGDIDGIVIDVISAQGFMNENEGKMKIDGVLTSDEQLGFVFPPGSELKAAFDAALTSMQNDGTLDQINRKWGLIQ